MSVFDHKRFIELVKQGCTTASVISKTMLCSMSAAHRNISFWRMHGEHIYVEHYIDCKRPSFDDFQYACMAENCVIEKYPVLTVSRMFRVSYKKLKHLYEARLSKGDPLMPNAVPLAVPDDLKQHVKDINAKHNFCTISQKECDLFLKCYHDGLGAIRTSDEMGRKNWGKNKTCKHLLFVRLHGEDAYIKHFVLGERPTFNEFQYACMVEFCIANRCLPERAALIFRASPKRMEKLYKKRISSGKPLVDGAVPANYPEEVKNCCSSPFFADQENKQEVKGCMENASQQPNEQNTKAVSDTNTSSNLLSESSDTSAKSVGSTVSYRDILTGSSLDNEQEVKACLEASLQQPVERKGGRATKPIPPKWKSKDKRSRVVAEQAKQQEQIKAAVQAQQQAEPAKTASQTQTSSEESKLSSEDLARMASDLLEGFRPASEWFKEKHSEKSRPKLYDPNSEGFYNLPIDVIQFSVKAMSARYQAGFIASKKLESLEPQLAQMNDKGARGYLKVQAINELREQFPKLPVGVFRKVFGVATALMTDYYKKRYIPRKTKLREALDLIQEIEVENNYEFGKNRICAKLRDKGFFYCLPTVKRMMNEIGIKVHQSDRQRPFSSYVEGAKRYFVPYLLNRDFTATRPREKVVTDVTEFKASNGDKVFLSVYLDLFNNEIIGWSLANSPSVSLVMTSFDQALKAIPGDVECIINSDQGFQYQQEIYHKVFELHQNLKQSMSRLGNCIDNAPCESLFGRIKHEMFDRKIFASGNELAAKINAYLHHYNEERIQVRLKGMSPIAYRLAYEQDLIA